MTSPLNIHNIKIMKREILQTIGLQARCDISIKDILTPNWDCLTSAGLKPTVHTRRILNAIAEIIRSGDETDPKGNIIRNASDLAILFKSKARYQDNEHIWLVTLNRNLKVLNDYELSVGSDTVCSFDIKDVIRKALFDRASGIILLHNHPSGDPHPSTADMNNTENLRNALKVFSIHLTDHIILADKSYYSFSEEIISEY